MCSWVVRKVVKVKDQCQVVSRHLSPSDAVSGVCRKFPWGVHSLAYVWCRLHLVCVVCDVIIRRRSNVFQTNVLAKFALISHSRQNKGNRLG